MSGLKFLWVNTSKTNFTKSACFDFLTAELSNPFLVLLNKVVPLGSFYTIRLALRIEHLSYLQGQVKRQIISKLNLYFSCDSPPRIINSFTIW